MAKCEWIVAVHGGAAQGYLGDKSRRKYEKVMVEACRRASELLEAGGSAVDAAKLAVEVLEDDATTNAGFGSNLTLDGTVEVLFRLVLSLVKCAANLQSRAFLSSLLLHLHARADAALNSTCVPQY